MLEIFAVLCVVIALVIGLFFSGSKVDPDDNPIWDSPYTKARKRKEKLRAAYQKELDIINKLNLKKHQAIRWHYVNDHYINHVNLRNVCDSRTYYNFGINVYKKHQHKGVKVKVLSLTEILELLELTSTYQMLEEEELLE